MLENKEFAAYSGGKAIDEGLRNYMLQIYNYMAGGLCATAAAAYLVANSSLLRLFVNESGYTGFGWLCKEVLCNKYRRCFGAIPF